MPKQVPCVDARCCCPSCTMKHDEAARPAAHINPCCPVPAPCCPVPALDLGMQSLPLGTSCSKHAVPSQQAALSELNSIRFVGGPILRGDCILDRHNIVRHIAQYRSLRRAVDLCISTCRAALLERQAAGPSHACPVLPDLDCWLRRSA